MAVRQKLLSSSVFQKQLFPLTALTSAKQLSVLATATAAATATSALLLTTPVFHTSTIRSSSSSRTTVGSANGLDNGNNKNNDTIISSPNRMTTLFQQMKQICPSAIKAYANCVGKRQSPQKSQNHYQTDKHDDDHVIQGTCDKEFAVVKQCFQKVRKNTATAAT